MVQNRGPIQNPPSSFTPEVWIWGQEPGQWGEPRRACPRHHHLVYMSAAAPSERQDLVRTSQPADGRAGADSQAWGVEPTPPHTSPTAPLS